jgi:hypothetical protein
MHHQTRIQRAATLGCYTSKLELWLLLVKKIECVLHLEACNACDVLATAKMLLRGTTPPSAATTTLNCNAKCNLDGAESALRGLSLNLSQCRPAHVCSVQTRLIPAGAGLNAVHPHDVRVIGAGAPLFTAPATRLWVHPSADSAGGRPPTQ